MTTIPSLPKRRSSPWHNRNTVDDGVNVVQIRRFPIDLRDRADDILYTTTAGDTLWRMAARFYGEPLLWWIIMDKNKMDFPLKLLPGVTLTIPSPQTVRITLR